MEIIDVVDSAVKIGLGALISGIVTFTVTKANHNNDIEKEYRLQKIKRLDETKRGLSDFFFGLRQYQSHLDGCIQYAEKHPELLGKIRKTLSEQNKKISETVLRAEETRILLTELKDFDSHRAIGKIINLIADIRNPISLSLINDIPTRECFEKFSKETNEQEKIILNRIHVNFENTFIKKEDFIKKLITYCKNLIS